MVMTSFGTRIWRCWVDGWGDDGSGGAAGSVLALLLPVRVEGTAVGDGQVVPVRHGEQRLRHVLDREASSLTPRAETPEHKLPDGGGDVLLGQERAGELDLDG